jgi:hypothetical protein
MTGRTPCDKGIEDYWSEKPPKKSVHIIIEPPASTTDSDEVLELRKQTRFDAGLLNKSVHGMYFGRVVAECNDMCA